MPAWILWKTTDSKMLAQGYKSGILEKEPSWSATIRKASKGKWKVYVKKKKSPNPSKSSLLKKLRKGIKGTVQIKKGRLIIKT